MIDWHAVARHFRFGRELARQQEIRLKQRLWDEHEKRVVLVNAMTELLPRIVKGGGYCCKACWTVRGHTDDCAYLAALRAVRDAS